MKLLSFDTATKSTGYAIFVDRYYIKSGTIVADEGLQDLDRVENMIGKIIKLIDDEKPDKISAELTVVNRNVQTQRNLTFILGAIIAKCVENKIKYRLFRPTEWRAAVKDKGEKLPRKREELKLWSVNKVKENFANIEYVNDDVSDAILIGEAFLYG